MRGERLGNARVLGFKGPFCTWNARCLEFCKQNSMRALHATLRVVRALQNVMHEQDELLARLLGPTTWKIVLPDIDR